MLDPLPPPDLILSVHERRSCGNIRLFFTFFYRKTSDAWNEERFECKELDGVSPLAYLETLFSGIEQVVLRDHEHRNAADEWLRGVGTALARDLLPGELLDRLATLAVDGEKDSALTLLILSDECWVPWELLRLPGRPGTEPHFLAEVFALGRWLRTLPATLVLPLTQIGVASPRELELGHGCAEVEHLLELSSSSRRVVRIPARRGSLVDALASGLGGLHLVAHCEARSDNPDLWAVLLEQGERLGRFDLEGRARGMGGSRPLIYLSTCHGARAGPALAGVGSLVRAFLHAGAGAVVGAHWAIPDHPAADFARAFYSHFASGGASIGEAIRRARLAVRAAHPGDPAWLAFALFGDPRAVPRQVSEEMALPLPGIVPPEATDLLIIPRHQWRKDLSPPGALLRAEFEVVPFHGRKEELKDLRSWCTSDLPLKVRLYTGKGGRGKTRLALQLCHQMQAAGWVSGFIPMPVDGARLPPREAAQAIAAAGRPLLVVVDYAETRRGLVVPLLATLRGGDQGPVRVLLLAREAKDWWASLKAAPEGVGDLLCSGATQPEVLGPLAVEPAERAETFRQAARAFAGQLSTSVPPDLPADLTARYFEQVLLLHMSALAAVEGVEVKGEDGILDCILNRERRFWAGQRQARNLPANLEPGIGKMMAAVTLGGGIPSEAAAVEVLGELSFFGGQPKSVLTAVARLLHDLYPGDAWIEPMQPDLLGEHLVSRELREQEDREEIFRIVFGAPSTAPGKLSNVAL